MRPLSRPDFLALTRLELGQFRTLDRRGQLPFSVDQSTGRGYEFGEAFLTLAALALAEQHALALVRAADIASALPEALGAAWPATVEAARQLVAGAEGVPEILAGRAVAAFPAAPRAVAGKLSEIGEALELDDFKASGLILVSASRVLALLIQRTTALEIDVPDAFWVAPLRYRPRPAILSPDALEA